MTKDQNPGTGPKRIAVAPVEHPPAEPRPDDELRRLAAEKLAEHLDIGASLIARCEELAFARKGDRLGPLYAAARLLRANAQVAEVLAHVAQVETRHRAIVERIQTPVPGAAELNSKKLQEGDNARLALWDRLQALAAADRQNKGETLTPEEEAGDVAYRQSLVDRCNGA